MKLEFEPTLEHMCAVRIALRLYYNMDMDIQRTLTEKISTRDYFTFDRASNEQWRRDEQLAMDSLQSLSKLLRQKVAGLLWPMDTQVYYWKARHRFLEHSTTDIPLKCMLYWRMNGTIDYEKTARNIVWDTNVDIRIRFAMACTYFMEDEIFHFWNDNKKVGSDLSVNSAVRFWKHYLRREVDQHWSECVSDYFLGPVIRDESSVIRDIDYPIRLSSFFSFLPPAGKTYFLKKLFTLRIHTDDLHSCLRQISDEDRMQLFVSMPHLIICLLNWPFQIYFIDMANMLWNHINIDLFRATLTFLLGTCLVAGWKDFDYLELFREFWKLSPDRLKQQIKKCTRLFKTIKIALNFNKETAKLSLQEILEKRFNKLAEGQ